MSTPAQARDAAPALLVPAAWTATGAAHAGALGTDGLLIAHAVMAAFIAAFAVTGWRAMDRGALRIWRAVLVVGLGVTLAGLAGLLASVSGLQAVSLIGWMLLPTTGLAATGRLLPEGELLYYGGAAIGLLGTGLYLAALANLADLALPAIGAVGVGQTMGILEASLRNA